MAKEYDTTKIGAALASLFDEAAEGADGRESFHTRLGESAVRMMERLEAEEGSSADDPFVIAMGGPQEGIPDYIPAPGEPCPSCGDPLGFAFGSGTDPVTNSMWQGAIGYCAKCGPQVKADLLPEGYGVPPTEDEKSDPGEAEPPTFRSLLQQASKIISDAAEESRRRKALREETMLAEKRKAEREEQEKRIAAEEEKRIAAEEEKVYDDLTAEEATDQYYATDPADRASMLEALRAERARYLSRLNSQAMGLHYRNNIEGLRKAKNWSTVDLAGALGISVQSYSDWVDGKPVGPEFYTAIARFLADNHDTFVSTFDGYTDYLFDSYYVFGLMVGATEQ